MNSLFLTLLLFLNPVITSNTESAIDLSGKWTITGSTNYGNLSFDWLIVDSDDEIEITKLSRYGNGDIEQNVTYYSKTSSKVIIKTFEDVGVGPTTSTYTLKVVSDDLLKGSLAMKSGSLEGLPGMNITSEITMRRK